MNTQMTTRAQGILTEERPFRVLFVCTGNTCRSPMAAALYNHMTLPREVCSACADSVSLRGVAESAGLYADNGAPITPEAADALREAGVVSTPWNDYEAHTARTVTREMVESADLVVGITAGHAMELTMRFPECAGKIVAMPMDIADPFGQGAAVYRACLMQLRYCLPLLGGAQ